MITMLKTLVGLLFNKDSEESSDKRCEPSEEHIAFMNSMNDYRKARIALTDSGNVRSQCDDSGVFRLDDISRNNKKSAASN